MDLDSVSFLIYLLDFDPLVDETENKTASKINTKLYLRLEIIRKDIKFDKLNKWFEDN